MKVEVKLDPNYTETKIEIYTKEIGYEPSFYEVLVSGGTRKLV